MINLEGRMRKQTQTGKKGQSGYNLLNNMKLHNKGQEIISSFTQMKDPSNACPRENAGGTAGREDNPNMYVLRFQ